MGTCMVGGGVGRGEDGSVVTYMLDAGYRIMFVLKLCCPREKGESTCTL